METQREKIEAAQTTSRGSTTDPTGEQRNAYEPTEVPVGLTGFTAGLTDSPWEDAGPRYREDFEKQHGSSGRRWEDVEPGYRYAHEMSGNERHRGREWNEVEPDLRSGYGDWSRERGYQQDESAWERMKDDVRSVWDRRRGR